MVMGCNWHGHLGSGLCTSTAPAMTSAASSKGRTRRMGMNTLAFTAPMHDRFFAIDADCVPLTELMAKRARHALAGASCGAKKRQFAALRSGFLFKRRAPAIIATFPPRASQLQPNPHARSIGTRHLPRRVEARRGNETAPTGPEACGILTGNV